MNIYIAVFRIAMYAYSESSGYRTNRYDLEEAAKEDIVRSIDKEECKSIIYFSFYVNMLIAIVFLLSLYLAYHNPLWDLNLFLTWGSFTLIYIIATIFKMFSSFRDGKWLYMLFSFIFTAFPAFILSFVVGDCSGRNGGISSPVLAIFILVSIMVITTPFVIWQHVKPEA